MVAAARKKPVYIGDLSHAAKYAQRIEPSQGTKESGISISQSAKG